MPSDAEQEIVLRKFDGVNLLVDQAYLGPSYLRAAQNWIPGDTYRLTKTPGNTSFAGGIIANVERTMKLSRVYSGSDRWLYAVTAPINGSPDQLWVSQNDGPWTQVQLASGGNATFPTHGGKYDIEEMNGFLYIGNGVDAILRVTIGGTAAFLTTIASFTDGSAAPTITADPGAQILTGTYSYCWAIFNNSTGFWVERGQTRTITVSQVSDVSISFPSPTGMANALSTTFRAHLFVSPVNLPVEFGHDQNAEGLTAAGSVVIRVLTADGPPLPLRGVARTGKIFKAHRGRLWIAGSPSGTDGVFATAVVVPGLEQLIFNAGVFFPVNARTGRIHEDVTAIGIATSGRDEPDAPMVICGTSSTWLFYGDILDDPSAYQIEVSNRVGCVEMETMVETPMGLFFMGLESVYMIPPGGGPPVDVGWPIRPAIQAVPPNQRQLCRALYHKGFYKLAIVPAGSSTATQQWWLDLRQGVGQVPSWWGPSPRIAVASWTTGIKDPDESDAGYMASDTIIQQGVSSVWDVAQWNVNQWSQDSIGGVIEKIHQTNKATELGGGRRIISVLQTGDLDDNKPFMRKIVTRVRVTAFPTASTSMPVTVSVDGGVAGVWDAMTIPGPGGAQWNVDHWDSAQWGTSVISEGETIAPIARPRGRTISVQITHSDINQISLRDLEIRYLPVPRVVRSIPNDPTS